MGIDEPAAEQEKEEEVTVTYLRRKQKIVLRERARNA